MKISRILALFLCALTVLCSCGGELDHEIDLSLLEASPSTDIPADNPVNVPDDIENNTDPQPQPDPDPVPVVYPYTNPLTGLGSFIPLENTRPIAVMVNNIYQSLPQIGVKQADVVYEILEEGGITRLLCIYNDYVSIPEIGSIRSARDYYIDIADSHDAIYVHAGGSVYAYAELPKRGTNNLDGLYLSTFYRSAERLKTKAYEHTLMISGAGIAQSIASKKYRTESQNPSPLVFSDSFLWGDKTATHIEIPFSIGYNPRPYMTSFFDYNPDTYTYFKGHFNEAHIDGADGSQLSFTNVITLTCPMNLIAGDALGCIEVHFTGEGTGTYSVGGTMRDIVWKKEAKDTPYTLFEADGVTPLVLAKGKSYIALVPTGTEVRAN